MKLILNTMVRDEIDIVEDFVKFHLSQGIDLILAIDNGSIDGTTEVLEKYQALGCLELIRKPEHTLQQAIWMNELSELARSKHKASLVINSDADEFWFPKIGTLRSNLSELPPDCLAFRFPRTDFAPVVSDNKKWIERMVFKDSSRLNFLGRPLPGKIIHRPDKRSILTLGNHGILRKNEELKTDKQLQRYKFQKLDSIEILHFPVRSYEQLEAKLKRFGAALERYHQGNISATRAVYLLYQKYLAGELPAHFSELTRRGDLKDCRLRDYMQNTTNKLK